MQFHCWLAFRVMATVLCLAVTGSAFSAQPDDPFHPLNAAGATLPPGKAGAPKPDPTADLVRFEFTLEPGEGRRGQTVRLTITGTPKSGYHTYPLTQKSEDPAQDESGLNRLVFTAPPGLVPLQPVIESDPQFVVQKAGGVFLEHDKPFTWAVDILVLPDAKVGNLILPLTIQLFVCDAKGCVRGKQSYEFPIRVSDAAAVALTPELQARLKNTEPVIKIVPAPTKFKEFVTKPERGDAELVPEPARKVDEQPAAEMVPVGQPNLFRQLLLAMGAGFVMLFTPCVFPMIPVTVSFFLKQGEKEHHRPFILASVYSGTIILVLTFAVLVLGKAIQQWANNEWLNLGMGLLLLIFALSLFGMFELELPHFLTRFTSAREGTGYLGAFFMALTFTINSFTCTGPFLGPLLAAVKELKLNYFQLVMSALAYSTAFAAPFFVLALFPRLIRSLPKSGGWLNAVKVVMGFVELALAFKFFAITDAGLFPGNPRVFNYETVLCSWIALALACGLYLFGVFRLPHDTATDHIGVTRLIMATLSIGLAVYMTPLLWRKVPLGTVGEFLVAWLPQDTAPVAPTDGIAARTPASDHATWTKDLEKAWAEAKRTNKPIFIDFTGFNCQNCRDNEKNVFPRPEVRAELQKFVGVQLYTDLVPDSSLTRAQAKSQADRNMLWQEQTFGDVTLPLYAVLDPNTEGKPITEDGKLNGRILGQAKGTITDVKAFVSMLQKASAKQVAARD